MSQTEIAPNSNEPAKHTTKRLFIGFPIEVNSSLESAIKRTRISAEQKRMEVFWVPQANFHVTLNFLGATEVSQLEALNAILKQLSSEFSPIKTSLRGLGAFPDERHMRVIWVGVRKSKQLAELQLRLTDLLRSAGFPYEEREYIPHLTIGRLRKARTGRDLLSPYVRTKFGDALIREVVLYESLLHGATPIYKPLFQNLLSKPPSTEDEDEVD